jgi:hypothetical protein
MRETTRRMSDVFSKVSLDMFQTDEYIFEIQYAL